MKMSSDHPTDAAIGCCSGHTAETAIPGLPKREARISVGSSCHEWQDFALLPIPLPATIEHQRAQGCQGITRRLAPLHARILLAASDNQIIGFLNMRAANVPAFDASLPLVGDPHLSRLKIRN